MKLAVELIRDRVPVDPAQLADEAVDLRRLVASRPAARA